MFPLWIDSYYLIFFILLYTQNVFLHSTMPKLELMTVTGWSYIAVTPGLEAVKHLFIKAGGLALHWTGQRQEVDYTEERSMGQSN